MRDYGREQYEALRDDPPVLADHEYDFWGTGLWSGRRLADYEMAVWMYDDQTPWGDVDSE